MSAVDSMQSIVNVKRDMFQKPERGQAPHGFSADDLPCCRRSSNKMYCCRRVDQDGMVYAIGSTMSDTKIYEAIRP